MFGFRSTVNFLLICLLGILDSALAEIRSFNLELEPVSEYIHFVDGFLITPGYIDLSDLSFMVTDYQDYGDDDNDDDTYDDEDENRNGGGRRRKLAEDSSSGSWNGNNDIESGTALDIAVFHLPAECANTRAGCDWPDLGVGKRNDEGEIRYCCSNDALDMGLCQGNQYGRLIVDVSKYDGQHRFMNVPTAGDMTLTHLKYGRFEERKDNGKYTVVFANCNDEGRTVLVTGKAKWVSKHGYLPGDLFGLMYFFALLTVVYFFILVVYGVAMKINEEHTILVQKWVLGTICMGTLELFFRFTDLFIWNIEGERLWFAFYIGVIVGVIKRGVSRCLIVMVSLGWGVVRDDLGYMMKRIVFLGGVYIAVSMVRDIMTVIAYTEIQKMSQVEEDELFDIVTILTIVIAFIDVLFYLWIIDALNGTMEYLETMNQTNKLRLFLRLRCFLLFSILFAVMWAVFGLVDSYDEGIVDQEQEWVLDASMELNYIFVLLAVAFLWRPSETAKEYAYVMELHSTNDGEFEMADVPSAMDDDDDDDEEGVVFEKENGGFKDEPDS